MKRKGKLFKVMFIFLMVLLLTSMFISIGFADKGKSEKHRRDKEHKDKKHKDHDRGHKDKDKGKDKNGNETIPEITNTSIFLIEVNEGGFNGTSSFSFVGGEVGDNITLVFKNMRTTSRVTCPIQLKSPSGEVIGETPAVDMGENASISFVASEEGTYTFKCVRSCNGHGNLQDGKLIIGKAIVTPPEDDDEQPEVPEDTEPEIPDETKPKPQSKDKNKGYIKFEILGIIILIPLTTAFWLTLLFSALVTALACYGIWKTKEEK